MGLWGSEHRTTANNLSSWMIAAPMSFVTILLLMRDVIKEYVKAFFVRRTISRHRKHRREQSKKRR